MKGTRKVGGAGKRKKEIRAQTSSVTSAGIEHNRFNSNNKYDGFRADGGFYQCFV